MKLRLCASIVLLSITLLACSLAGSTTSSDTTPATTDVTPAATLPPLAPGTILPTAVPPTSDSMATVTPSVTITTTPTLTPTATLTPTLTPAPVSRGPLDFTVSIVGCTLDPARNGGVILTLKIEATGGNGSYTYYRENQPVASVSKRPATKGTAVIDAYRVTSGDGQSLDKKLRFAGADFGCP